ncbi:MAG: hypothetical protein LBV11_08835, partial [Bacillus cereus]|nr:hypothetical protein [Bacillus cereus]
DKALFNTIKNGFEAAGDSAEQAEQKTTKLLSSISEKAGMVANIVSELQSMFGGMNEGLAQALSAVGNIAQGFTQGGIIGGAMAAVGEGMKLFSKASEAAERHKETLKVINETVKAQEHAYQLALLLKDLEYKKGDTVFGDDPYGKAINAAKDYKEAIDNLKESLKGDGKLKQSGFFSILHPKTSDYAALQNIDIVTGHKKTGLFGWGKGKDTYSGILKIYPDLIDGQGKFNTELAKTVLTERKMSDENKAALQRMIDNADAIEEAYSIMGDYLTGIFGNLGNSMTDALVDAFSKGEDAAAAFYNSATSMIENLVKDMINSIVIAPVIQKATEDAMKVMENTSLTSKQRMDSLMQIVDNSLEQGFAATDTAKDLYDYANKAWKDKTGKELFKPEVGSFSQSSSRGGFETMTQDQAGELNERFTALQMSGNNIEAYTHDLILLASENNEVLKGFSANFQEMRNVSLQIMYDVSDIKKSANELYQINERLAAIEKNTQKL